MQNNYKVHSSSSIKQLLLLLTPKGVWGKNFSFFGKREQSFELVPEKRIKKQTNRKPHKSVSCSDINDDGPSSLVVCVYFSSLNKTHVLDGIKYEWILEGLKTVKPLVCVWVCFCWNGLPVPGGGGQKNNWTLKSEQHCGSCLYFPYFASCDIMLRGLFYFISICISEEWTNDWCCLLINKSMVDVVCPRMWMSVKSGMCF